MSNDSIRHQIAAALLSLDCLLHEDLSNQLAFNLPRTLASSTVDILALTSSDHDFLIRIVQFMTIRRIVLCIKLTVYRIAYPTKTLQRWGFETRWRGENEAPVVD
jgi:hypothetical protein